MTPERFKTILVKSVKPGLKRSNLMYHLIPIKLIGSSYFFLIKNTWILKHKFNSILWSGSKQFFNNTFDLNSQVHIQVDLIHKKWPQKCQSYISSDFHTVLLGTMIVVHFHTLCLLKMIVIHFHTTCLWKMIVILVC